MKTFNFIIKNNQLHDVINFNEFKTHKNLLIQVFCGENKDILQNILNTLKEELPQSVCIASSTDGEIFENSVYTLNTVISLSTFENTSFEAKYFDEKTSFENGTKIAKTLIKEDTKLLICFTDGEKTNGEEFLKGIETVNNKTPICGGMAADNASFTQTFIAINNEIYTSGAIAVSLNSKVLDVKTAFNFNWSAIGVSHVIDEVKDNRVYKISGLKSLDFYEKYLGEYVAKSLPATGIEFPLIVKRDGISLARAVIKKYDDGSLSFAGNLLKGDRVKLGFGNIELIMNNPLKSLFKTDNMNSTESFFIYSCMARRRYMPNIIDLEIEPFSKIAPTSGFFTYGEFFHNKEENSNQFLNQTLTVVALSEKEHFDKTKTLPKKEENKISEHARSLQALTHLIQQSAKDYNKQSKELEEKTLYSEQLLNLQKQFLKHSVHETNTPLSVIMGNIDMYKMEHGKNKYISNIEIAMKTLFNIYDDLSYLIKKDHVHRVKHQINLVDFVRSRIEFFSLIAKKAKLDFNFNTSQEEIYVFFDETKLQRIVDNNLTNAIKYTLPENIIDISIKKIDSNTVLNITSISKQILDKRKIFEEYYREQTTQNGFGLGLNLVKRICEEEDVKLELESNENFASFIYTFKDTKNENTST
ncbi:diguanylate cyclase [Arcobacter sp. CECT 8983]|uniref:FIST N-terminal domain-containing protein n=1 Tax=Arcobacter sp. CECT 8983 TaxID=2044508 RepID=UPI00100B63AF|nr:FIST N-terminal domain-containing protein [Arcobacter sp. CECT 8983]RXJ89780.1 diguanylate cyclase [Arcobacter sp. CECT 8983]